MPGLRRTRLKLIALAGLAFIGLIYLLARPSGSHHGAPATRAPSGNPPVVLVTVLDEEKYSKGYLDTVRENRIQYAEKHGTLRGLYHRQHDGTFTENWLASQGITHSSPRSATTI